MQTHTTCRVFPLGTSRIQSTPSGCMRKADRHGLRFRRSSATFDWWETGLSNRRPSLRQHCDRRAEGLSPHSTRPRSEPQGGLPGETVAESKFRSRAGPRPGMQALLSRTTMDGQVSLADSGDDRIVCLRHEPPSPISVMTTSSPIYGIKCRRPRIPYSFCHASYLLGKRRMRASYGYS